MCWLSISVHSMAEKSTFHLKCILLEQEGTPPAFLFVIPTKEWIITKWTKTACKHLFPSLTFLLQLQERCWKLLSPLCLPSSLHLIFKTDKSNLTTELHGRKTTFNWQWIYTPPTQNILISERWFRETYLLGSFLGMRGGLDRGMLASAACSASAQRDS